MNRHNIIYLAILLFAASLQSCQDEIPFNNLTGDEIFFKVVDDNTFEAAGSRSAASDGSRLVSGGTVTMESDSPKPIYLHTYLYEGIEPEPVNNEEIPASRASQAEIKDASTFYDRFMISAYFNPAADGSATVDYSDKFLKTEVMQRQDKTDIFKLANGDRFWPTSGSLRFLAFAPTQSGWQGMSDVSKDKAAFKYVTPEKSHSQPDIVYAVADASSNPVTLKFKHALTRVKFKIDPSLLYGRINYIKLKNIHGEGTYTFPDVVDVRGEWTLTDKMIDAVRTEAEKKYSDKTTYENQGYVYDSEHSGEDVSADYRTVFMLLPQTFSGNDKAELEISYTPRLGNEELLDREASITTAADRTAWENDVANSAYTLSAKLNTMTDWPEGHTVVYKISASSFDVETDLRTSPDIVTGYRGGIKKIEVTSFAAVTNGGVTGSSSPTPWKAEFVDASGNVVDAPYWIENVQFNGNGGSAESFDIKIKQAEKQDIDWRLKSPHRDAMRAKGTKIDVEDMSMRFNNKRNTANCYIINQAGTYTLPLVYGNAIQNDKPNPEAYMFKYNAQTGKPGDLKTGAKDNIPYNALQTFFNYKDVSIKKPYIADDLGYEPSEAVVIWQYPWNLVKSVALIDGKNGRKEMKIETCSSSYIQEGNVTVGIKDSDGKIMWSWHLWFTDYEPRKYLDVMNVLNYKPSNLYMPDVETIGSYNNEGNHVTVTDKKETFMPVPLGWCGEFVTEFDEDVAYLRITQVISEAEPSWKTIKITREKDEIFTHGIAPFYQFGRKDPLRPGKGYGDWASQDLQDGTSTKTQSWLPVAGIQTIGYSIQNPNQFIKGNENDWCVGSYYNLWSSNIEHKDDLPNEPTPENWVDVKTIYDPCPVGYEIPDLHCFHFTTNGGSTVDPAASPANVNAVTFGNYKLVESYFDKNGFIFYCTQMKDGEKVTSGGVISFPALGQRSYQGTITWTGTDGSNKRDIRGYYWTSTPQFLKVEDENGKLQDPKPKDLGSSFGFRCKLDLNTFNYFNASIMPLVQSGRVCANTIIPIRNPQRLDEFPQ